MNQYEGACQYARDNSGSWTQSVGWYKNADGSYSRGSLDANCVLSTWAPADHTRATAHCCQPTYFNPGYNVGSGEYANEENALAACKQTAFTNLCSTRQVREISYWGESANQGQVSSVFSGGAVGWFENGALQSWDGLTGWPASRGAHCCSDYASYKTVAPYAVLPETLSYADSNYWNGDTATAACQTMGYDGLCTVGQIAQAVSDGTRECFVGWALKDDQGSGYYTPGYWGYSGCGTENTWNDEYNPYSDADGTYPGAHCCNAAQASASVAFPVYVTKAYAYQYTEAQAQEQCVALSSANAQYNLCSRGQVYKVATQSFDYNGYSHSAVTNMCTLGWTRESDGSSEMTWYQVDNVAGCGNAGDWNYYPANTQASYHCCQDFPADDIPTPIYETLKWAHFSQEDAAAQCRTGADLCTRDQLAKVATTSFDYNGMSHTAVTNMCSQGWTKNAGLGWWQVDDEPGCSPIGLGQMNAFSASTGTFHCCLGFDAPSSTTPYETRQWFYYTAEEAAGMCGTGASLCSKEQLYRVATETFDYNGMTVEMNNNICSQGWVQNADGSTELGWYQGIVGCGDSPVGWNSFNADSGTFHCCMPFEGRELPTEAPATDAPTDEPETVSPTAMVTESPETVSPTAMVTEAPVETDASLGMLPSSKAQPEGCTSIDFTPEGFSGVVSYCEYDGMVYLEGYSTCILSNTGDLTTALQNSWDNDWYLGASESCTGRTADATTDDQLYITNKMCDNLEADIDSVESQLDSYMSTWTQQVTDLVNSNMANFDAATQQALTDYLATLNGSD